MGCWRCSPPARHQILAPLDWAFTCKCVEFGTREREGINNRGCPSSEQFLPQCVRFEKKCNKHYHAHCFCKHNSTDIHKTYQGPWKRKPFISLMENPCETKSTCYNSRGMKGLPTSMPYFMKLKWLSQATHTGKESREINSPPKSFIIDKKHKEWQIELLLVVVSCSGCNYQLVESYII